MVISVESPWLADWMLPVGAVVTPSGSVTSSVVAVPVLTLVAAALPLSTGVAIPVLAFVYSENWTTAGKPMLLP
jgi:hypothetical protein